MKILLISDNFPPEKNALANRSFVNSKLLSKKYDLTVLTCLPNYPYGKKHKNYSKKLYYKETDGRLKIIRLPSYISKKNNGFLNFFDYLSFGFISFFISFFFRKNLIYATSPPLPVAFLSVLAAKLTFTKCILEVRDLWSDSIFDLKISENNFTLFILKIIENITFKLADSIFCVTEGMKKALIKKCIEKGKIIVMPNGYISKKYSYLKKPIIKNENLISRHFRKYNNYINLTFIGTIGASQDLGLLKKVANYFADKKVIFTLVGNGSKVKSLKSEISREKIDNIHIFETEFNDDETYLYKKIKFGFSFLKKNKTFRSVIPSKIYDYAGNNIFIIFNGPKGDASNLIEKKRLGKASKNYKELTYNINLLLKRKNFNKIKNKIDEELTREYVTKKIIENIELSFSK